MHTALAAAAGLVAMAFAASTFERWLAGRRRHELAWSIALGFFSLAAFALAAGAALGWAPITFRLFYLFGAIVNVPVLALGTVYLLAGEQRGDRTAVAVGLSCSFAAGIVLAEPLRASLPSDELAQGSDVFGPGPRIFAAAFSGLGAMTIFVGAVWSAYRFRKGRMLWSNVLIALGTLVLSSSGLLNSVLDEMDGFAVTLVVGISVIFAGFLVAAGGQEIPAAAAEPGAAERPSPAPTPPRPQPPGDRRATPALGEAASRSSPAAAPRRS